MASAISTREEGIKRREGIFSVTSEYLHTTNITTNMRTSVILLIFALVACAVAENIYLSYWSGSGSCSGTSTKAFNVGDNKCYGIVDNYLSYKNRTGNNVYFWYTPTPYLPTLFPSSTTNLSIPAPTTTTSAPTVRPAWTPGTLENAISWLPALTCSPPPWPAVPLPSPSAWLLSSPPLLPSSSNCIEDLLYIY